MKSIYHITLALLCLLFSNCYKDNREDLNLLDPEPCNFPEVFYTTQVVPIFERNCYSCHDAELPLGGINMENYSEVFELAKDGSLLGSIKHESPYIAMPPDEPKMDDCEIEMIEQWIAGGAKED